MTRWLALGVLALGVALAGAAGARNGDAHTTWRTALGEARATDTDPATLTGASLPPPGQRLLEWAQVGGVPWVLGLALVVGGGLWLRRLDAPGAGTAEGEGAEAVSFEDTVHRALSLLREVRGAIAELPMNADVPALRHQLDDLAMDVLLPAVDARERWIARDGLVAFADYWGEFSAGERLAARTWSALTDGHTPEARDAVDKAIAAFERALAAYREVVSSTTERDGPS